MTGPAADHVRRGFTLIEVLVVLAILALLMGLAAPKYFHGLDRSKEAVLRQNLFQIRESIDKHFADTGRYPERLDDLVEKRYLRSPPVDPVTQSSTTWVVIAPKNRALTGIYDVRSGATGKASDGTAYGDW